MWMNPTCEKSDCWASLLLGNQEFLGPGELAGQFLLPCRSVSGSNYPLSGQVCHFEICSYIMIYIYIYIICIFKIYNIYFLSDSNMVKEYIKILSSRVRIESNCDPCRINSWARMSPLARTTGNIDHQKDHSNSETLCPDSVCMATSLSTLSAYATSSSCNGVKEPESVMDFPLVGEGVLSLINQWMTRPRRHVSKLGDYIPQNLILYHPAPS